MVAFNKPVTKNPTGSPPSDSDAQSSQVTTILANPDPIFVIKELLDREARLTEEEKEFFYKRQSDARDIIYRFKIQFGVMGFNPFTDLKSQDGEKIASVLKGGISASGRTIIRLVCNDGPLDESTTMQPGIYVMILPDEYKESDLQVFENPLTEYPIRSLQKIKISVGTKTFEADLVPLEVYVSTLVEVGDPQAITQVVANLKDQFDMGVRESMKKDSDLAKKIIKADKDISERKKAITELSEYENIRNALTQGLSD